MIHLETLKSDLLIQNQWRNRLIVESPQGPRIQVAGKTYLSFSSNDYLGLANHPEVKAAAIDSINRDGLGSGASHLVTGHHREHHLFEEALADFLGVEAVLLFSTGYMANLGVVSALFDKTSSLFEDKLNHASLLDAGLFSSATFQRYHHGNVVDLQQRLADCHQSSRLIISDGVFSMDGDIAPISELVEMCREYKSDLFIDDAHGFGVLGKQGKGSIEHCGLQIKDVSIFMGTLGKALGSAGAFVAAEKPLIDMLIQRARTYIYTTAMPPALAAAARKSLAIIQAEPWRREHLQQLIKRFRSNAAELNCNLLDSVSPIQPIIIGDNQQVIKLSQGLLQRGIQVSAIRPPTVPKNQARLRITLSALHTEEDVDFLVNCLADLL